MEGRVCAFNLERRKQGGQLVGTVKHRRSSTWEDEGSLLSESSGESEAEMGVQDRKGKLPCSGSQ